jgi:hypothetical protein
MGALANTKLGRKQRLRGRRLGQQAEEGTGLVCSTVTLAVPDPRCERWQGRRGGQAAVRKPGRARGHAQPYISRCRIAVRCWALGDNLARPERCGRTHIAAAKIKYKHRGACACTQPPTGGPCCMDTALASPDCVGVGGPGRCPPNCKLMAGTTGCTGI